MDVVRTQDGRDRAPRGWREHRLTPAASVAAALGAALLVAPTRAVPASACPPTGEGRGQCLLTEGWVPYVTSILLIAAGLHLTGRVLVAVWRRMRAGERVRVRRPGRPAPAVVATASPELAAAAWAHTDPRSEAAKALATLGWARSGRRSRGRAAAAALGAPSGSRPIRGVGRLAPYHAEPTPAPMWTDVRSRAANRAPTR